MTNSLRPHLALVFLVITLAIVENGLAETPVESWDFTKFEEGKPVRGSNGNAVTPEGVVTAGDGGADLSNGGYLRASQSLGSLTGPTFSVVCKVQKQADTTVYGTIFHSAVATIRLHGKDLKMACDGNWHAIKADGFEMTTGEWTQVAGTFDGTEFHLYVDGKLKGSWTAVSPMRTDGDIIIGGRVPTKDSADGAQAFESFPGLIKSVQIFDQALTPEALKALP